MPNIRPVSDLRNYTEVLHQVDVGEPVFLTRNGRGQYAIVDMRDYERLRAALRLARELERGRLSGENNGWTELDDLEKELGVWDE